MRCLKVTDALAASGPTRGLELEEKRYALNPVSFSPLEWIVTISWAFFLSALLLLGQTTLGNIILWRV
jgi:energy-coupling factor transport system permease protein